ncbi:MAG: SGNH/GDSL hydrolase family protein [Candidatus Obscuribacter sp.]|nr:SGNH/GDSL hydrolase family protein [Candidatus Obscuribacter sp.]
MPDWIVDYTEIVANTLNSPENLGIATLGSSLILAVMEDDGKHSFVACRKRLSQIAGGNGPQLSIAASPGNAMSDCEKITESMLARPTDKKPKLILATYSYRDFCDNLYPDPAESPVAKALDYGKGYRSFLPRWQNMLSTNAREELLTCLQTHERHIKRVAALFRKELTKIAETCRSKSHQVAEKSPAALGKSNEKLTRERDLAVYKTRYQPLNLERFRLQIESLERLLRSARQRGVPVLLVNMPVTDENLKLIPPAMRSNWQKPIKELAANYGAALKDFDTENDTGLTDADFTDSVHLNRQGAAKFLDALFSWMVNTNQYKSACKQK